LPNFRPTKKNPRQNFLSHIFSPLETLVAKIYTHAMSENLIEEFVDKKSLKALGTLVATTSDDEAVRCSLLLSNIFSAGDNFKTIADQSSDGESRLVSSFNKNLVLLIQKTWVEKSDEELKAQVLYELREFCENINSHNYVKSCGQFFSIVDNVVYLMFGVQTKSKDFSEYALRIDPEFGVFWWYMKSLPRDTQWTESKTRIAILLGMYFLANY
jgi:hypothetical protein